MSSSVKSFRQANQRAKGDWVSQGREGDFEKSGCVRA
jgi:hypothetical protein